MTKEIMLNGSDILQDRVNFKSTKLLTHALLASWAMHWANQELDLDLFAVGETGLLSS